MNDPKEWDAAKWNCELYYRIMLENYTGIRDALDEYYHKLRIQKWNDKQKKLNHD